MSSSTRKHRVKRSVKVPVTSNKLADIPPHDQLSGNSVKIYQLNLSGALALSICNLPKLLELNLSKYFISAPILNGFVDCFGLEVLDLCTNRLHGPLLTPIWKITTLRKLYLCQNYMFGEVPEELGNLVSLEELVIYSNNLTGRIPSSIGKLK
ncbi:hypothetical protein JHK87_018631 [Glycine soja]|nr:hypothetical protein JHK87_018631 [Glycine soja]